MSEEEEEEEEEEEQYLVKNSGPALLQGWILPAFAAPPARHHVQRRSAQWRGSDAPFPPRSVPAVRRWQRKRGEWIMVFCRFDSRRFIFLCIAFVISLC